MDIWNMDIVYTVCITHPQHKTQNENEMGKRFVILNYLWNDLAKSIKYRMKNFLTMHCILTESLFFVSFICWVDWVYTWGHRGIFILSTGKRFYLCRSPKTKPINYPTIDTDFQLIIDISTDIAFLYVLIFMLCGFDCKKGNKNRNRLGNFAVFWNCCMKLRSDCDE